MGVLTNRGVAEQKAVSFIQTIKCSTADLHLRLESQALLTAIMQPTVTPYQYACYLTLMKKIEEVYEEKIVVPVTATIPGITSRTASKLIAEDLFDIGQTIKQDFLVKDYLIPGEKNSTPFAVGFMYVMEGSKLGGKVIYKHIQRTLGYSNIRGARFIADYGNDTFGQWKQFLSHLSTYVTENACEGETIKGAEFAFSSIYEFFELNRLAYEN